MIEPLLRQARKQVRAIRMAGVTAMVAMTTGCGFILPDRIHYEWQPDAAAPCIDCGTSPATDAMVGLALSGGGSRAAVFSAAVLASLTEHGLAGHITHISSVSGGGFAASYYATHPPASTCDLNSPAADICLQSYFATFDATMREDFTTAMVLNQIVSPGRITSPTRRATSLQEAFDESFLNGTTFGELPPSPILLLNAASYDDGRRFIFSNAILDESRPEIAPLSEDVLRWSSFSRADCPQPTPADLPLSLAVVASAAFPPVIGPVTVQATRSCADATPQYWHLGDGGIIDNTGADTLRELVVRGVHDGSLTGALIFVADAGARSDPEVSLSTADLSIFTSNPGAVVDVAQARGIAYSNLFWQRVEQEIGIPFDTITFRHDEAEIAEWPESCSAEQATGQTIDAHLSTIPTALDISECDADLIKAAADEIVQRRLAESGAILSRHGISLPHGPMALAE